MQEGFDPFAKYQQMHDDIRQWTDEIRKYAKQYGDWRKRPMQYLGAWWEPKFAWLPTLVYDPPADHDALVWVSKNTYRVWLRYYLRRKYITNASETGWNKIKYSPNGLD